MNDDVLANFTLLAVNAASGLALGMSVVVLGDVMGWRWAERKPWLLAALMIAAWLPFALSGVVEVRRVGNTVVSLYMCWLFLAYDRRVRDLATAAARRSATGGCSTRASGGCIPAQRTPVEDTL